MKRPSARAKAVSQRNLRTERPASPLVPLPDILEGDLDIIFVGINTGTYSAKIGHYYARPQNLFWPMLHQSGLLPFPLKPEEDWKLVRFRMGLTDAVKRVTDSSSDLSEAELKEGGEIVRRKIMFYQPRIICFNGLTSYRALFGSHEGPGPKPDRIGTSHIFVVPSTSRRNAFYGREKVLFWFSQLNQFRKQPPSKP
jgi:TDG/mug DNA glycosylase family protein